jgi:acetyl-CoA carboxylase biotin carboxyl carrier protein
MNIKEVKDLIHEILQSDISEFELEHTGTKVRLRRGFTRGEAAATSDLQINVRPVPVGREPGVTLPIGIAPSVVPREESPVEEGIHVITSPIVGTFYRSPSPTAEPYVKIGSKIEPGTMLCIVEAMKLMNEIPSDVAGEVVEIYVENGQPVEFGQKLFAIRPQK